jgi:phosphoribosylformimino-5-aminoimidazole carboxamide ribotide isomerase
MIIYPAIDIQDGTCVRLKQGNFAEVTKFNNDILSQAKIFEDAGFEWLHIVDLDGARKGKPVNMDLITKVIAETNLKVQIGGGIRELDVVDEYISSGAARVILGTAAIKNIALVEQACKKYPGKIAVGLDARGNRVSVSGWLEETDIFIFDLIEELEKIGVAAIIYTDIERDGLLTGFDAEGTNEIARTVSMPIIASGGVSDFNDLLRIKEIEKNGVSGVIIGRAFYEKKINFIDALGLQN